MFGLLALVGLAFGASQVAKGLMKTPKVPTPKPIPPAPVMRSPEEGGVGGESLYKRLAKMFGRQNTVLTGPLGESNRKTLLGA